MGFNDHALFAPRFHPRRHPGYSPELLRLLPNSLAGMRWLERVGGGVWHRGGAVGQTYAEAAGKPVARVAPSSCMAKAVATSDVRWSIRRFFSPRPKHSN